MFNITQTKTTYLPAAQPAKLYPQPTLYKARVVTVGQDDSKFMCEVSLAERRNYVLFKEVYLTNGKEQVMSLRPAYGELRRSPKRFTAVVWNAETRKGRTVEVRIGQLLVVWG